MSRPSPSEKPVQETSPQVQPEFQEDQTDKLMTEDDRLSLEQIQSDLRTLWKGNEEVTFYEKLAKFKKEKGEDLFESDVYDVWIDEWTRKMQETNKFK